MIIVIFARLLESRIRDFVFNFLQIKLNLNVYFTHIFLHFFVHYTRCLFARYKLNIKNNRKYFFCFIFFWIFRLLIDDYFQHNHQMKFFIYFISLNAYTQHNREMKFLYFISFNVYAQYNREIKFISFFHFIQRL